MLKIDQILLTTAESIKMIFTTELLNYWTSVRGAADQASLLAITAFAFCGSCAKIQSRDHFHIRKTKVRRATRRLRIFETLDLYYRSDLAYPSQKLPDSPR